MDLQLAKASKTPIAESASHEARIEEAVDCSEAIAGGDRHVARFAVNDVSRNVGVIGFIKKVIDVALDSKIFSDLIAAEHIH